MMLSIFFAGKPTFAAAPEGSPIPRIGKHFVQRLLDKSVASLAKWLCRERRTIKVASSILANCMFMQKPWGLAYHV